MSRLTVDTNDLESQGLDLEDVYLEGGNLETDAEVELEGGDIEVGIGGGGAGIQSIEQTVTSTEDGGINEVTQTLTNGTTAVFQIRNGSKGSQGERGETGPQGPQGPKGDTGDSGIYPVVNQTAASVAIEPNVLNIWGEMAALTITLAAPTDNTVVNEYMIQFTSPASSATTLSIPSTVTWVAAPSINAGVTYQISIINNLGIIAEFSETA